MEKQRLAQENQRLIEDLSDKNQQLETTLAMMQSVNRACAVIASSLDISDILKHLVEIAVEQLQGPHRLSAAAGQIRQRVLHESEYRH